MDNREKVLENLHVISNLFYQLKTNDATQQLLDFIKNIEASGLKDDFSEHEQLQIQNTLLECMTVINNKDYILIADLIYYEILTKVKK